MFKIEMICTLLSVCISPIGMGPGYVLLGWILPLTHEESSYRWQNGLDDQV